MKIYPEQSNTEYKQYAFFCPGCKCAHAFNTKWQFNGDMEKPTITPSILVTWPANPKAEERFKEWRTERKCHSYVTDGRIQFLSDCTHDLKGQTVDLPDF